MNQEISTPVEHTKEPSEPPSPSAEASPEHIEVRAYRLEQEAERILNETRLDWNLREGAQAMRAGLRLRRGLLYWHLHSDAPQGDALRIALTRSQYVHIAQKHGFCPLSPDQQGRIDSRPGIEVNDANGRALKQALREANGRASENVLTCGCDIQHLATSFEAHLDELRIPETEREGIVVRWRRPGPGRAYRATMIVSDVQLLRGAETWYLHDVSRATVVPETAGIEQIRVAPDRLAMFGALLHPAFVPAPEEATDA